MELHRLGVQCRIIDLLHLMLQKPRNNRILTVDFFVIHGVSKIKTQVLHFQWCYEMINSIISDDFSDFLRFAVFLKRYLDFEATARIHTDSWNRNSVKERLPWTVCLYLSFLMASHYHRARKARPVGRRQLKRYESTRSVTLTLTLWVAKYTK